MKKSFYKIPPPNINLSIPKTIATMHMVLPLREFTMLLKMSPRVAIGILIQLSQPSSGIKATSIMIKEMIPQRVPSILMIKLVCLH